jgi:hypothetical protein
LSDDERAQKVLKNAAASLGWPETVTTDESDNIGTGKTYTISEHGTGSDEDIHGSVAVFGTDQEPGIWLTFLEEQLGLDRSSYLGRDAVISRYGKNCNPEGLVKVLNEVFVGIFESIFGESDDPDKNCVTQHGAIFFSCGKYLFAAGDSRDDEGGEEDDIAAALYSAAQEEGLCEYGDTLVIMADTPDRPGAAATAEVTKMSQRVNEFYGVNSMGAHPPFKFTIRDADGSRGVDDWYHVTNPLSSYHYPNGNVPFAVDATKKAFGGADLPQDLYLERIVVVFAGDGHQADSTASFSNADSYLSDDKYIEVDAANGKRKIFTKNIILLSENRELGGWVHEFGHSLESRYKNGNFYRISDRYNYDATTSPARQFGNSNVWDLMCSGSHWGSQDGDKPTQMASFTKYAAKWLEFKNAELNKSYAIDSLEHMKKGDAVLRIDDPTSNNPEDYMIVEARDATAYYGAPASGVVLYQVRWDQAYDHHIVNFMGTQSGTSSIAGSDGRYWTPTMYSASPSPGSTFLNPLWQMKVTVTSITRQPFAATVKIEEYKPNNLAGAVARPGPTGINGGANASLNENALPDTLPDMDLHAYDDKGNHVGVNYQTEEYENTIPGAIASGNLKDDAEWIFIPEGTNARYEISTYRTQQFLASNPGYAASAQPQNFTVNMVKFDAQGNRYEADGGNGSALAGENVPIRGPFDSSLRYERKGLYGVGVNSLCPFLPVFVALLLAMLLDSRKR